MKVFESREMDETIDIVSCRKLREAMDTLTASPLLTKREYMEFLTLINKVCKRMSGEDDKK